jgi:hypothetical protein
MQGRTSHLLVKLYVRSLHIFTYLPLESILHNDLAVADFYIKSCGVEFYLLPASPPAATTCPGKLNLGAQSTIGLQ